VVRNGGRTKDWKGDLGFSGMIWCGYFVCDSARRIGKGGEMVFGEQRNIVAILWIFMLFKPQFWISLLSFLIMVTPITPGISRPISPGVLRRVGYI